jgi:hypothetical protein
VKDELAGFAERIDGAVASHCVGSGLRDGAGGSLAGTAGTSGAKAGKLDAMGASSDGASSCVSTQAWMPDSGPLGRAELTRISALGTRPRCGARASEEAE